MNEIEKIETDMSEELMNAFEEMPQARTDYVLKVMVIGGHDTIEQQYAHCVLELRLAYNALRKAKIHLEKTTYVIGQLKKKGDKMSEYKWREKEIDQHECKCAVIGKLREFNCLYKLWQSFPKKFTRKETNEAQPEYWNKRLTRQANQDMMANGRIGAGNQEALRQIGKGIAPQLDHVRDIEKKYLENGNVKIMIAVATEVQAVGGLPCIDNLIIPSGIQCKIYNCHGRSTAEAYNDIAREFLKDDADYLLTIEDDTFPPADALVKLLEHMGDGKKAVGGWYPKRNEAREGVPIVLKNGTRQSLGADDKVHEVYTLPMGCTLYSAEVFYKIEFPWFERTDCLSQDSFFSQKLREAGFKLYVDTSIRCKHIDRATKKVFQ